MRWRSRTATARFKAGRKPGTPATGGASEEAPGAPPTADFPVGAYLLQERQHALRGAVGLGEHARPGLLQDLELREVDHLCGHVHVADAALGGGQVLLVDRRVLERVPEAVLHGAERRTLSADDVD